VPDGRTVPLLRPAGESVRTDDRVRIDGLIRIDDAECQSRAA
jgi:hypothetical protein